MAIQIPGTSARDIGGQTGRQIASQFATIQTAGVRELADAFRRKSAQMGKDAVPAFRAVVRKACMPISRGYIDKVADVTGNLRKSVGIETVAYDSVVVGIVGPRLTGTGSADPEIGSGNHAWLVEFGTGPRRPGTQNRRTYVNVHQQINGRMSRKQTMNDEQFRRAGAGYYFLMGSKYEPTRQARAGSGYPHDFMEDDRGGTHPMTLKPGEFLKAMPAQHAMQRTIDEQSSVVQAILAAELKKRLDA